MRRTGITFNIKLESHDVILLRKGLPVHETIVNVDESAVNFAEYFRKYGVPETDETRCAPFASYGGGRGEFKSRIRCAMSAWVDRREPIDMIRDRLEERGIALSRQLELSIPSLRICRHGLPHPRLRPRYSGVVVKPLGLGIVEGRLGGDEAGRATFDIVWIERPQRLSSRHRPETAALGVASRRRWTRACCRSAPTLASCMAALRTGRHGARAGSRLRHRDAGSYGDLRLDGEESIRLLRAPFSSCRVAHVRPSPCAFTHVQFVGDDFVRLALLKRSE